MTREWDLRRFDRIIISRDTWLGFKASDARTSQEGNWYVRFRVKLMGDHEVTINSYTEYHDARRLAVALSGLTVRRLL